MTLNYLEPSRKLPLQDLLKRMTWTDLQTLTIMVVERRKLSTKPNIDPTLTDRLALLAELSNKAGAEGIWLIRGATAARLTYTPAGEIRQPNIPDAEVLLNLELSLDIADAGIIVLMCFPASDGAEAGIEAR